MSTPRKKSIYGVHPGVLMTQKWIAELKQKTGRNLDEWVSFVRTNGPSDVAARRIWLKDKHNLEALIESGRPPWAVWNGDHAHHGEP